MAEEKFVWLEDKMNAAKTHEEREQILKEWEAQKVAEAVRKEEIRLNSPTMIDKFMDGIRALKKKLLKNRENGNTMSGPQKTR